MSKRLLQPCKACAAANLASWLTIGRQVPGNCQANTWQVAWQNVGQRAKHVTEHFTLQKL